MSRTLARLRGIRRVLGLLLHLLAGLWTVYAVFPLLNPARRQQRVQAWAATLLRRCGLAMERRGAPAAPEPGHGLLLVSNHISWLDIPALHALVFCRFVSKSEVRRWPVVGRLASAAHTLYLQRASRRDAHRVLHDMADRLRAGDVLAVFPEGTTSNGLQLLPFHGNLLQAAISADACVQPVAIQFFDRAGEPSLIPCYVGSDTLIASLWRIVCAKGLVVRVSFGIPQKAGDRTRQEWADAVRAAVSVMRHTPA